MSISSAILSAQAKIAAAYQSCDDKGATMPTAANQNLSHLADTIDSIPTGGGGNPEAGMLDVVFIDYDGTIVYSYTAADFLALSAMPANPDHTADGLTSQGWNWTLADAQTYVTNYGALVIGQMYITTDGATKMHITLDDATRLTPVITVASGTTIDWGDGTTETITSSPVSHTYSAVGNFVISFKKSGGTAPMITSTADTYYCTAVLRIFYGDIGATLNTYSCQLHTNLEICTLPSNVTSFQSGGAFYGCTSLKSVTLPDAFTTLGNQPFFYCGMRFISFNKIAASTNNICQYSCLVMATLPTSFTALAQNSFMGCTNLQRVVVPASPINNSTFNYATSLRQILMPGATTIGQSAFAQTAGLNKVTLPSSLTTIGVRAFEGSGLVSVTIPANVATISNYAFYNCLILSEVHCLPTSPPSAGTGIFQSDTNLKKIYVPTGSLAAYQGASGWSTYASLMEEE